MEGACLIDLEADKPAAPQAPAASSVEPSHAAGHTQHALDPQQQDPAQRHHDGIEQQQDSSVPCLKAAAERAARTGEVLQKHSMEQGESNAKLRLLLATVAAKQVKARKMLAELSSEFTSAVAHSHSSSVQQVQDLTMQLQQAQQQAAAAQAEAERQRRLAAQQTELAQLREGELQDTRVELKALRKAESRLRHELRDKESQLLDAQAALSRLTAELPGSRQHGAAMLDTQSDDGSSYRGSSVVSTPAGGADAADTADSGAAGGALLLTPVGNGTRSGGGQGAQGAGGNAGGPGGAAVGATTHKGLSIMTPDQAAAVQLREWLDASQKALMEAHEDLLAKEKEIKALRKQLQQQQGVLPQPTGEQQPEQDWEQEQDAAEVEAAADKQQQLVAELDSLRSEMLQLRLQLEAAESARTEAVAALKALQQQQQQQDQQQQQQQDQQQQQQTEPPGAADTAAAAAAAERAAAAEAELQAALAAAADAAAEVQSLRDQLEHFQQQQQQDTRLSAVGAGVAAATATQPQGAGEQGLPAAAAGQDSSTGGGLELLQAQSRIHVLQEELQNTQESMQLLLGLVKKCAAAAAAAGIAGGEGKGAAAGAAGALSGEEQQQLQRMLAAAVPAGINGDAAAAPAAAGPQLELGLLHGLLHKLECRYNMPKPLQDVVLRGREMEHLLSTALQRVHAIKAEAGGGPCACPTEADYRNAGKAAQQAAASAEAQAQQHAAAAVSQVPQEQQLLPGFAVIDTAAAAGGPTDTAQFGSIMQSSSNTGWDRGRPLGTAAAAGAGEGYGMVSEASILSAGGHSGGWDSWDGQASAQLSEAGAQGLGGTSYNPITLQGFSADSSEAGSGAVAAVVGGGAAGLAPLVDENLGYDGLEGAWWATSNVKPVTVDEIPDFLLKKG